MEPAIGATNTIYTYTFVSGIDQVGNAGQIPSSGAIQMNHFRGTANSPSNTSRGMAGFWFRQSIGSSGGWSNHQVYVVIQGTFGTNYQAEILGILHLVLIVILMFLQKMEFLQLDFMEVMLTKIVVG